MLEGTRRLTGDVIRDGLVPELAGTRAGGDVQ